MKQVFIIFFTITSISLVVSACSKSSGGGGGGGGASVDCSTVANKAFTADVNPIIQSTCNVAGCHAAGSTNGPGALTTHAEVFAARVRVRAAISSGAMPQGTTLSTAQKNSIICWIDSGAPNN
jgi:uncharacterized membrane protein